jgi:hypothetical protein
MLGKLSWSAIPFSEPLPLISTAVVASSFWSRSGLSRSRAGGPICGASG